MELTDLDLKLNMTLNGMEHIVIHHGTAIADLVGPLYNNLQSDTPFAIRWPGSDTLAGEYAEFDHALEAIREQISQ